MWENLRYRAREYIKITGWKRLLFRFLLFAAVIYYFLPDVPPPPEHYPAPQVQQAPTQTAQPTKAELPKLSGVLTSEDLRAQMTTHQSSFYWRSFDWMVAYGNPGEVKDFNDKVISVTYRMGEQFTTPGKFICRPYAEEIIMAGKRNQRQGVACQFSPGQWCRQEKGENPRCRFKNAGGLTGMKQDWKMLKHNFDIDWDRNMQGLPGF